MRRARSAVAFAALAAVPSLAFAQSITDATLPLTAHASGFTLPTGIEFLGRSPTDFFVIEKNSGLVQRYNNGAVTTALDLAVANDSERGLLGIARDPNFAANNYVYLYYSKATSDGGTWTQNQLSRFTWNGTTLGSELVLKTFGTSSDGQATGPNHDAGPILFGPDGKLYGTTGDLNRSRAEQNNQSTPTSSASVGGIYRLNSDGTIPADNPFISSPAAFQQWYAYGVRNTFGLNFDPLTGVLWDTENGPATYDEVNRVAPGFNSGWTKIMGPDSRDAQGLGDLVNLAGSGYSDPEFSWLDTIAPTGISFGANSMMDLNYRDGVLVADSNNGNISLLRLNTNRDGFVLTGGLSDLVADSTAEQNSIVFGSGFSNLTELATGPDGGVYVTSLGSGTIWRIGGKSWKSDSSSTWETASNWQGGLPVDTGDTVNFFETVSAARTITFNNAKSLAGMMISSPFSYTFAGTPTFAFSAPSGSAYLRVLQGNHTIDKTVNVASAMNIDIMNAGSLLTITGNLTADSVTITKGGPGTIEVPAVRRNGVATPTLALAQGKFRIKLSTGTPATSVLGNITATGGQVDVTNSRTILKSATLGTWNGTNYTGITGLVKSGRNGGAWDGSGIVTSQPAASAANGLTTLAVATATSVGKSTFGGESVTGADVLVMYTYAGDANLTGLIDGDDYFRIDTGRAGSLSGWVNGDFDYSGKVDADDYFIIDRNYSRQGDVFASLSPGGVASVPESGALAWLAVACLPALRRRK